MRNERPESITGTRLPKYSEPRQFASAWPLLRRFETSTVRANIVLVVLAFALPLALSSMYFLVNGIDKDIEFARVETHGTAYQRPLESLLEDIAAHDRWR